MTSVLGIGVGLLLLGISFDHAGGYNPGLLLFVALSATAFLATFVTAPIIPRVGSEPAH